MGLRTVVVVGLVALATWLLVRGVLRRRVPWIGIAVLLVPAIALGVTERQWNSTEQKLSGIAKALAPGTDGVHCQRLGETFTYAGAELGHVEWDEDGVPVGPAMVSYETCQHLAVYWRSSASEKAAAPLEQVIAVHVLTHEAMHQAGHLPEAEAECAALQHDAWVAGRLGADAAGARHLVATYLAEVYPRMPSAYVTPECREGGGLDRTPSDGSWP